MFKLNSPAKRLFFVAGLLVFVGFIINAIGRKSSTNTSELRITITDEAEARFITKQEIRQTIIDTFQHNLGGVPIGSINVKRVEEVLERNPFIDNADVFVDITNHVNIKISQRKPVVRIIDLRGTSYYLDEKGRYMGVSKHYTARVPVVTGFIRSDMPNLAAIDIRHPLNPLFLMVLAIQKDNFLSAQIEQIYIDKEGEFTLITKLGDAKILLGDAQDLVEKFKRLKIFFREAVPYEGWTKYKTVNVKFNGQIVCEKR